MNLKTAIDVLKERLPHLKNTWISDGVLVSIQTVIEYCDNSYTQVASKPDHKNYCQNCGTKKNEKL